MPKRLNGPRLPIGSSPRARSGIGPERSSSGSKAWDAGGPSSGAPWATSSDSGGTREGYGGRPNDGEDPSERGSGDRAGTHPAHGGDPGTARQTPLRGRRSGGKRQRRDLETAGQHGGGGSRGSARDRGACRPAGEGSGTRHRGGESGGSGG